MLDTRELARRPGSMRTVSRTVPAPADLGTAVLGVAEGSDLRLELRLESVLEGVLVSGTVRGRAGGECVRCLDDLEQELEVSLQELHVYPGREAGEEDDVRELDGDLLDLEPALRDAVVLALPFQPVCTQDCPGLCADCGARLADDPEHAHESTDPRWQALSGLLAGGGTSRTHSSATDQQHDETKD